MRNTQFFIDKAKKNLNIQELNAMQKETIAAATTDQDIVLLSPTGTGKTLAFLLPMLSRLDENSKDIQALILAPARELALQITSVVRKIGAGFKIECCYGGHPVRIEKKSLQHAPAILIGTPGRIADHIRRENVDLERVKFLVLDEFDKSLEFGFQEEMQFIIEQLFSLEKRILTSATSAINIPAFVGLKTPKTLQFLQDAKKPKGLTLKLVSSPDKDKLETLYKLICRLGGESMLIFVNFREAVERVQNFLQEKSLTHGIFHGGLEQMEREKALMKFRNGTYKILVTTDLASRGLDIPEIKYIIHYHLPTREEPFIHRNGRTARMNARGTAFLLMYEGDDLPDYIRTPPGTFELFDNIEKPEKPEWATLFIGKGKKDKVNKIDVVGFLSKKAALKREDVGLIEVKDFFCYVAVKRNKIHAVLKQVKGQKIKGKKAKIEIAR